MANNHFHGYVKLGRHQIERYNPTAAIENLKQALQLKPDSATVYALLAQAHNLYFMQTNKRDHLTLAKEHIDRAIKLAPEDSQFFYIKASIFSRGADRKIARKLIAHAIELNANVANYYVMAGNLGTRTSGAYFEKALELDPVNVAALASKANNYLFVQHDVKQAELYAQKALTISPNYPLALTVMAHVLLRRRKRAEAMEHVKMILAQNPREQRALSLVCMLESNPFLKFWYGLSFGAGSRILGLISFVILGFFSVCGIDVAEWITGTAVPVPTGGVIVLLVYIYIAILYGCIRLARRSLNKTVERKFLADTKLHSY